MLTVTRNELALVFAAFTALILYTVGADWDADISDPVLFAGKFVWLFGAMIWAAFAAVRHADSLAEIFGEPYGTLILTISVISIEISVIAAVMFAGEAEPTLPRDTMLAILMIVLNLMVGISLLIGGVRYREQSYSLEGARTYLAVIITLSTMTLIVPRYTISTSDPTLTTAQAIAFSVVTLILYGTFLAMQTVRHQNYFRQPKRKGTMLIPEYGKYPEGIDTKTVPYHAGTLVFVLVMIVLMSKEFGPLVDDATVTLGAPSALGGILIAVLVLAPEGLAAFNAAASNHLQRAVNICMGSALATISLTVPAVVAVSFITGTHLILGLAQVEMILLGLSLILCMMTFGGTRTNMLQGVVHLIVFVVFVVLIFDP